MQLYNTHSTTRKDHD